METKSKKILITSTDVMMLQFLIPHAFYLKECGYTVEIACSDVEGHIDELREIVKDEIPFRVVQLSRRPTNTKNFRGLSELKNIISNGNYDLIWTNEPVMSIMTRLASKLVRSKAKVLYIAHGFHFFKGASIKNWMLYFPIEKLFSRLTDEIITINQEDFLFAEKHFKKPKIAKLPGIGINTAKFNFSYSSEERAAKRAELGISDGERLIISVGELEARKNHETAIKAFCKCELPSTKMIICGIGSRREKIEQVIAECNMQDRVFLLGYRYDIKELCHSADAFLFVTYQEGLSVALMEAMSVGLPCVISKIRGNIDLIDEGMGIFCNPHDVDCCADAIKYWYLNGIDNKNFKEYNRSKLQNFDFENVKKLMANEISDLLST